MEKFLKVTVNGVVYDVKVEDVKPCEAPVSVQSPVVAQPAPVATAPIQKPEPEVKPSASAPSCGSIKVAAPMPGNIWKIKTSVGATVNKHDVLLILEAMKLENEIVAPEAGTVTAILVKEGDAVEPGRVMVEMA